MVVKPALDAEFPGEYEIKKKKAKPLWASKTPADFLKNMQNSEKNDQILGHFWKIFFCFKVDSRVSEHADSESVVKNRVA